MTISNEYWQSYMVTEKDLEDIYNFLLETESPLDKFEISRFLIDRTIADQENFLLSEASKASEYYLPEKIYSIGDKLVFPAKGKLKGSVKSVRNGNNPDFPDLQVIDVELTTGERSMFAANFKDHKLNNPQPESSAELLDVSYVFDKFGSILADKIADACAENDDLVCIARRYFPRALLFDISIGHLNLCEAVLEMTGGGPLSTNDLIEQIELPISDNEKLTEFSLNYALAEDGRFDEVGPTGVTLWFLKRLEPQEVQNPPFTLLFNGTMPENSVSIPGLIELNGLVDDELELEQPINRSDEVTVSLSYPHWRAGTLPLTSRNKDIFPTAYETPRVKFIFCDANNQDKFPGWVVRPSKYVFGLKGWYEQQGVIPGSYITIRKSTNAGEVLVQTSKSKSSRDWIRTVLVGADGGIVFALLKQVIACKYDDRMAIMITDVDGIDAFWNSGKSRQLIDKVILTMMRELGKLNLQNQIHAQELYSAINLVKRTPPSVILSVLHSQPWAKHLGDLYFTLEENS